MRNVEMGIGPDGVLTIRVDLRQTLGPSKSGKTELIASTEGGFPLDRAHGGSPMDGGTRVNLTVYRYPEKEVEGAEGP